MKTFTLASAVLATVIYAGISFPAEANPKGTLPKDAVALTSDEVKAFYVGDGQSLVSGGDVRYFAPDGKVIAWYGANGKKEESAFGEGKWTVVNNEFCEETFWLGKDKAKPPFPYIACDTFYKSNNKVWIQITTGTYPFQGDIGNTWTNEKRIQKGDLASAKIAELKTYFGY